MSLLEQAIVDAQELKEAALKSAESAILEKYSADIREAVDSMLGQEEEEDPLLAMGAPADPLAAAEEETLPEEGIPYAADAEVKLCPCPDDEEEITISFDQLQTMAGQVAGGEDEPVPEDALAMAMGAEEEEEEIPMMESIDLDELLETCGDMMPMDPMEHPMEHEEEEGGEVKNITINLEEVIGDLDVDMSGDLTAGAPEMQKELDDASKMAADASADVAGTDTENFDFTGPELAEMVREALKVDLAATETSQDWINPPVAEINDEEAKGMAEESDTSELPEAYEIRLAEAIGAKDAQIKDLKEKLQTLAESSTKLKQTFMLAREQFEETNLSNAKLLYTNRTLKSTSLNERQKNRIADSIQSAETIEEAKVIFETLQSAVGGPTKSTPKSLNEAIKRPSMNVPRRRRENSSRDSVVRDRFQALAGIKK